MSPFADVVLSAETATAVSFILTGLAAAVVANFRFLMQSHKDRVAEIKAACEAEKKVKDDLIAFLKEKP